MKYIKQLSTILAISLVGELLKVMIPLAIPASIYGLILMFLLLNFKVIHLEQVKDTALFFIEVMPIMFIPAAVGLLTSWNTLKAIWFPITIITIASTVIVMGTTGLTAQGIIRRRKKD